MESLDLGGSDQPGNSDLVEAPAAPPAGPAARRGEKHVGRGRPARSAPCGPFSPRGGGPRPARLPPVAAAEGEPARGLLTASRHSPRKPRSFPSRDAREPVRPPCLVLRGPLPRGPVLV